MTPDHYVYVMAGPDAPFTSREAIEARGVRAGMLMWHVGDASAASPKLRRVQAVRQVIQTGFINVFTVQGTSKSQGLSFTLFRQGGALQVSWNTSLELLQCL